MVSHASDGGYKCGHHMARSARVEHCTQGSGSCSIDGESMGMIDVFGDGVPYDVCLSLLCEVKTRFELSASHS
jgi:hypothetical protein